tara:strand:+ start:12119 stop:12523 length:405 start_codon:yes stop_codon:yes gene_type:complete
MIGLITSLLPVVGNVLDRVLPDTVEKDKVKAELQAQMLQHSASIERAAADVVVAEAKGESWIQRSWRPITMLSFVVIIVNNYIVVPWLKTFGLPAVFLEIPPDMWTLLSIGIGGYICSRGAEKGIQKWRDGDKK